MVSNQDQHLLLAASFCLGSVVVSSLGGLVLILTKLFRRQRSWTITNSYAVLYFFLSFLSNASSIFAIVRETDISASACSFQAVISNTLDQLSRMVLLSLLISQVILLTRRKLFNIVLYSILILRFGIGLLLVISVKGRISTICFAQISGILNIVGVTFDVMVDAFLVLLVFVTPMHETPDAALRQIRFILATGMWTVIVYHLSTILRRADGDIIMRNILVPQSGQVLVVLALIFLSARFYGTNALVEVNSQNGRGPPPKGSSFSSAEGSSQGKLAPLQNVDNANLHHIGSHDLTSEFLFPRSVPEILQEHNRSMVKHNFRRSTESRTAVLRSFSPMFAETGTNTGSSKVSDRGIEIPKSTGPEFRAPFGAPEKWSGRLRPSALVLPEHARNRDHDHGQPPISPRTVNPSVAYTIAQLPHAVPDDSSGHVRDTRRRLIPTEILRDESYSSVPERSASTVDYLLARTPSDVRDLLLFDLDGGTITPITPRRPSSIKKWSNNLDRLSDTSHYSAVPPARPIFERKLSLLRESSASQFSEPKLIRSDRTSPSESRRPYATHNPDQRWQDSLSDAEEVDMYELTAVAQADAEYANQLPINPGRVRVDAARQDSPDYPPSNADVQTVVRPGPGYLQDVSQYTHIPVIDQRVSYISNMSEKSYGKAF